MRGLMIRYRVKPDRVAENEELVRAVYAELHETGLEGLHYATFRLPDGVSFVHVAFEDIGPGEPTRLQTVEAFRRFQENIGDRLEEGPTASPLEEIGSYRLPG